MILIAGLKSITQVEEENILGKTALGNYFIKNPIHTDHLQQNANYILKAQMVLKKKNVCLEFMATNNKPLPD